MGDVEDENVLQQELREATAALQGHCPSRRYEKPPPGARRLQARPLILPSPCPHCQVRPTSLAHAAVEGETKTLTLPAALLPPPNATPG